MSDHSVIIAESKIDAVRTAFAFILATADGSRSQRMMSYLSAALIIALLTIVAVKANFVETKDNVFFAFLIVASDFMFYLALVLLHTGHIDMLKDTNYKVPLIREVLLVMACLMSVGLLLAAIFWLDTVVDRLPLAVVGVASNIFVFLLFRVYRFSRDLREYMVVKFPTMVTPMQPLCCSCKGC